MDFGLKIDDRELMRMLDKLPDRVENRVVRRAVAAGGTPILRAQRSLVPVKSGKLKASLAKKTKIYDQSGTAVAMIGPRIKKGTYHGYHGHLIEKGHINVDGSFTPGEHFMEIAQETAEAEAIGRKRKKLVEGIMKEAAAL